MDTNISLKHLNGWVYRVRIPTGRRPFQTIVMLHGLTGDENSMWVFSPRLPKDTLLIAPRGFYPSQFGGFSWVQNQSQAWPDITEFIPAMEKLFSELNLKNFPQADFSTFSLVGFSQGAAFALTILAKAPDKINLVAGLSGFLPAGAVTSAEDKKLSGKQVFLAHGTKDSQIPVEMARQAAADLEAAAAKVIYCEDDIGHKLSASCFQGLEAFFKGNMGR